MTLELHPPEALERIVRSLEDAGCETWVVGGVIRDALAGEGGGDWDLATRATPSRIRRLFRRTVPLGIEHGTVGVIGEDEALYQVTTFRRDIETDGRHARVSFADTIEEDLSRRDFTINALAWSPSRGKLVDPFGGAADLAAGVLRSVGEARERFAEDYLRVLRGVRFAGRFGLAVEVRTWLALCEASPLVARLSAERVREELFKVLGDPTPRSALELYADSGALAALYPELDLLRRGVAGNRPLARGAPARSPNRGAALWESILRAVNHLPAADVPLRLAALLRRCPPGSAQAVATRLKLSRALGRELELRTRAEPVPLATASDADRRRWLSETGIGRLNAVARIELAFARTGSRPSVPPEKPAFALDPAGVVDGWRRLRAIIRRGDPLTLSELAIDGNDLRRLGVHRGPPVGQVLRTLMAVVLDDPAENTAARLEARVVEFLARGRPSCQRTSLGPEAPSRWP